MVRCYLMQADVGTEPAKPHRIVQRQTVVAGAEADAMRKGSPTAIDASTRVGAAAELDRRALEGVGSDGTVHVP